MPDTYWVSRTAKSTTIFEIQDLFFETKRHNKDHHHTNVDWESLCLQAQELSPTSEALQYQRRILRILERTNKLWCALRMQSVSAASALENPEAEVEEDRYDSDCPEHGYDGRCRPGLSEDEDDAHGLPYKSKIEALGKLDTQVSSTGCLNRAIQWALNLNLSVPFEMIFTLIRNSYPLSLPRTKRRVFFSFLPSPS